MRSSNGGLAYGTNGNPQTHIMQEAYAAKVAENEAKLKELAPQLMIDEALVAELERDGAKFTRKDMLFVTRDKTGQIVWLEKGNAGSGMGHIKSRGHDVEIAKAFGIPKTEVEVYLRKVISEGSIVRNELKPIGGRMGYERVYYYEGEYCIVTGVGTNGFIVSAYPPPSQKGEVVVTIKIMNEFLHGPVWTCEEGTGIPTDALPLVHEDPIVASLNREIGELFDSYYEFDSHDLPCWFNEKKEKADKPRMLELLGKLNARIAELNDGSFVVDDQETPRIEAL